MPKMKTKSGAKKRFKPTASGMLKAAQAGKRHGMIKRSKNLKNHSGEWAFPGGKFEFSDNKLDISLILLLIS